MNLIHVLLILSLFLAIGIVYEVVNDINPERHFLYGIGFLFAIGVAFFSGIILILIRNHDKRRQRIHSKYYYQ